jgi:ribonuclease-3
MYVVVREYGPDHEKVFEVELVIQGRLQGIGTGKSKKEAEQTAARKVLESLTEQEAVINPRRDFPC